MESTLEKRHQFTVDRLNEIKRYLEGTKKLIDDKACVYATGSFARGEASEFSDLDLFIVGLWDEEKKQRRLERLDEICIKADLIQMTKTLNIPKFSGDGEYLTHHTVYELIRSLGKPEDDATNTFTARLLLLLESYPLLGESVYHKIIDDVIAAYWQDYEDHRDSFMPAFLANDILRLWRTFCVNYEARTQPASSEDKEDKEDKKAKRKIKNYKLKHSRLLTCFSALACILVTYQNTGTVSPVDMRVIVSQSPIKRLQSLKESNIKSIKPIVDCLLNLYGEFLEKTNKSEEELKKEFCDSSKYQKFYESTYEFGDQVFKLIEAIGTSERDERSRFYRLLLV